MPQRQLGAVREPKWQTDIQPGTLEDGAGLGDQAVDYGMSVPFTRRALLEPGRGDGEGASEEARYRIREIVTYQAGEHANLPDHRWFIKRGFLNNMRKEIHLTSRTPCMPKKLRVSKEQKMPSCPGAGDI